MRTPSPPEPRAFAVPARRLPLPLRSPASPAARLLRPARLLGLAAMVSLTAAAAAEPAAEELVRQLNRGKAQLENGAYAAAIGTFEASLQSRPEDAAAWRNLARARLFNGQAEAAQQALEQARRAGGTTAATEYLEGLARLRLDQPAAALDALERAASLDPHTAAVRFQLAKAYEALDRADDALLQYRETARLDPQHAAAQFELAMYSRQRDDRAGYREALQTYKRLRDAFGDPETSPLLLEACRHTQAEPAIGAAEAPAPPAGTPAPLTLRLTDATAGRSPHESISPLAGLAPLELTPEGTYRYFALDREGFAQLLETAEDGTLQPAGRGLRTGLTDTRRLIRIAHYHDSIASRDRLNPDLPRFADVLVIGRSGARLLERSDPDTLTDVTERAGLADARGDDAAWLDYEHDGDLDLLTASETGLTLWQNDGSGRFIDATAEAGIAVAGPVIAVATADLDDNGGVDIVVARTGRPTLVLANQRAGRFAPITGPTGQWPEARHVLIDDLDHDGAADVVLGQNRHTVIKWGRQPDETIIPHQDLDIGAAALVDLDNNGWLDLCMVGSDRAEPGRGRVVLWRNGGHDRWNEAGPPLGLDALDLPPVGDLAVADADADGDSDLFLTVAKGRLRFLENDGGNRLPQLKVNLSSLAMLNHGGIGATVQLRAGTVVRTRFVTDGRPIEIGLGGVAQLDSVQVVWPDGTVDNALDVSATQRVLDVRRASPITTGSCPYLYAWDGDTFRFVTDFLGSGALGLAITRDVVWPADPIELIRIGDEQEWRPREGRYALTITSELREVDYFDSVELLAVDHRPGVEVHPTDSFMPPPVTPSAVWPVADPLPLIHAHDAHGTDLTEPLRRIDGVFAPPGAVLPPPLRGVCEPATYTMAFRGLTADDSLALVLTGLLEFGTASSNIALSQTDTAALIWPTLEAETADGQWQKVPVNIGIPDGRTKSHVCDLTGLLPPGVRRLRLTTSFQIHWDRIALMRRQPASAVRVHRAEFTQADLRWRGFSAIALGADGISRIPDFDQVSPQPPWHTTLQGWCTRYGDVKELIAEDDAQIAVLNGGDALTLEVPVASLPPKPAGYTRTFFLAAVGWDKEENVNTLGGDRVEPLPGQPAATAADGGNPGSSDWVVRYNTRWVPRDRFKPAGR